MQVDLLQQRLTSTEQQLRHVEEQLRAMPAYPHSPRPKGSPRDPGAWNLETVVEQLRRVLEVKEDRIRLAANLSGPFRPVQTPLAPSSRPHAPSNTTNPRVCSPFISHRSSSAYIYSAIDSKHGQILCRQGAVQPQGRQSRRLPILGV